MNKILREKLIPLGVGIIVFLALSLIYLSPLMEGKSLKQDDIMRHKGMAKEVTDFRDNTGEEPLWTNSMFSGMPAYQISVKYHGNLLQYFDKAFRLGLPRPADYVFLYMLGFFILLLALRVNPWLGIIGAIAFGFSSYQFIILEAGHNSKAHALGYVAPMISGILLLYQRKYWLGAVLTLFFMSLQIRAGHPQITYYMAMMMLVYGLFEFVSAIRKKAYMPFIKSSAILALIALIGVMTHITSLWATWEYGKYTIRGKSELTTEQENRTSGLDKDYATQWSYGVAETGTLIIPNFHGGASVGKLGENSATYEALIENQIPRAQAKEFLKNIPTYWGTQPFTSGPVYAGAIVVFLFVLGMFIIKGNMKWWLFAATLLSIFLSWGKNFMPLTEFFLDYFPGYNKFRAVSMTLVIAEFTLPLLGLLALNKILKNEIEKGKLLKALQYSVYITGGFVLLFVLVPGLFFTFTGPGDASFSQSYPQWLMEAFREDRKSMLRMDALRSLFFILATAAIIWVFVLKKLKITYALLIIGVLVLIDMWTVNKRYLDNDDFIRKARMEKPYQMSEADKLILKDTDPHYRVLNLTTDPFADARTSYFHKSIGGYHGAKLRRYQELYDHQVQENFNREVLNMLNTKYIIQPNKEGNPAVIPNMDALGNAWFVSEIEWVENADEELAALTGFDASEKAVADQKFKEVLGDFAPERDSLAMIKLVEYAPNQLNYQVNITKDQLAVFSEIYYDKGWNAYIDGELTPHIRVDYVLRALKIPAGKHLVEFKFEPRVYAVGEKISFASSLLVILVILGYLGMEIRKVIKKD